MGMNSNSVQGIQQGLKLFEDVLGVVGATANPGYGNDQTGEHEEQARMMELDAMGQASDQRRHSKKTAEELRSRLEDERGRANTAWGRSGLAMGGSKELVKEARMLEDRQDEEDLLHEGEMEERAILDRGRRQANRYRMDRGVAPSRSTLSLGSSVYNYRR